MTNKQLNNLDKYEYNFFYNFTLNENERSLINFFHNKMGVL